MFIVFERNLGLVIRQIKRLFLAAIGLVSAPLRSILSVLKNEIVVLLI